MGKDKKKKDKTEGGSPEAGDEDRSGGIEEKPKRGRRVKPKKSAEDGEEALASETAGDKKTAEKAKKEELKRQKEEEKMKKDEEARKKKEELAMKKETERKQNEEAKKQKGKENKKDKKKEKEDDKKALPLEEAGKDNKDAAHHPGGGSLSGSFDGSHHFTPKDDPHHQILGRSPHNSKPDLYIPKDEDTYSFDSLRIVSKCGKPNCHWMGVGLHIISISLFVVGIILLIVGYAMPNLINPKDVRGCQLWGPICLGFGAFVQIFAICACCCYNWYDGKNISKLPLPTDEYIYIEEVKGIKKKGDVEKGHHQGQPVHPDARHMQHHPPHRETNPASHQPEPYTHNQPTVEADPHDRYADGSRRKPKEEQSHHQPVDEPRAYRPRHQPTAETDPVQPRRNPREEHPYHQPPEESRAYRPRYVNEDEGYHHDQPRKTKQRRRDRERDLRPDDIELQDRSHDPRRGEEYVPRRTVKPNKQTDHDIGNLV